MTQDQITSLIRLLVTVSGPAGSWLISRGFSSDQVTALQTLLVSAVFVSGPTISLIWGMFKHSEGGQKATMAALPASDKAEVLAKLPPAEKTAVVEALPDHDKLAAVEAMPQVASIVVTRDATNGLAQAAADPERPKVVMKDGLEMAGGRDGM